MCVAGLDECTIDKHRGERFAERAIDNSERWEPLDVIDRFFKR
jgi:hypothetical protein